MQKETPHNPGKGSAYLSGRKSRIAFITVNQTYGRIYFSAYASKLFNLMETGFEIFEQDKGWFFKTSISNLAKKLTYHSYAYYYVDRKLVDDLMAYFPGESPVRLNIEDAENKALKYLLTKSDRYTGKGTSNKLDRNPPAHEPGRTKASAGNNEQKAAMKLINLYIRTNFQGRVKTLEVVRAERILNTKIL